MSCKIILVICFCIVRGQKSIYMENLLTSSQARYRRCLHTNMMTKKNGFVENMQLKVADKFNIIEGCKMLDGKKHKELEKEQTYHRILTYQL